MKEDVIKKLESLGYIANSSDEWALGFIIDKVETHIKNSCNTTAVPEGLHNVAVGMVCGEFLFTKKQSGQLELTNLDLEGAVQSISAGDTNVSFTGASDDDKFTALLNMLMHPKEGDFVCYRTMQW